MCIKYYVNYKHNISKYTINKSNVYKNYINIFK